MFSKKLKEISSYVVILAAGLGCGAVAMKVPEWLKPQYQEGNYAAYFPNAQTKVVVYGTTTCQFCKLTRDYLQEQKIVFADYDINSNEKALKELKELGGLKVPVILIGDRRIDGFDREVIADALAEVAKRPSL
jgi:mycoredoxin